MLTIKRIYETPLKSDGYRILADRLWPRGISKEYARLYKWAKEVTPSTKLRNEFHHHTLTADDKDLQHDPAEFKIFEKMYAAELSKNPDAAVFANEVGQLLKHGNVTLLTASRDVNYSHMPVLKNYIEKKLKI